ncbi:MAG: DUF4926 domain-containing protein [Chloroflexi bacterium RIFOXYC12_FULL_59_14]|nr:MAG: DUF4926 domain-containing protein [Chloroflexi bacterium RIFOXYC12_FULL_59_14]
MIRELDTVVLSRDLKEYGLTRGDVGAVVHCYTDNKAFEVEFVTGGGRTIAVVTLSESDIRPMQGKEILHVRTLMTGY